MLNELRRYVKGEEFDYGLLMNYLKDYKKPRDKVSRLLKTDEIIRVKKGLYVFGDAWRRGYVSREVLANLIYGPSYISLEYALGFYGLIPERVEQVTSMTSEKNKIFKTPLGVFTYKYIDPRKYPVGVCDHQIDENRYILIASKEKALADLVAALKKKFANAEEMQEYLFADLRLDEGEFESFNRAHLREIAGVYRNRAVDLLDDLLSLKAAK